VYAVDWILKEVARTCIFDVLDGKESLALFVGFDVNDWRRFECVCRREVDVAGDFERFLKICGLNWMPLLIDISIVMLDRRHARFCFSCVE
jgi:hypothetical protein